MPSEPNRTPLLVFVGLVALIAVTGFLVVIALTR